MTDPKQMDFGDDPELASLQRRRALALALSNSTMKAQGGSFRKSPIAVIADFLALKNARDEVRGADAQELAIRKRLQETEQRDVGELIAGMGPRMVPQAGPVEEGQGPLPPIQQPGDPRAAVMKALASQSPRARSLAMEFQKQQADAFKGVLGNLRNQLDPASVISSAGAQDIGGLKAAPPPGPPTLESFTGPDGKPVQFLKVPQLPGQPPRYQGMPTQVNATATNAANKPGYEVIEQIGKNFAAGGKDYEKLQNIRQRTAGTTDMLRTLMEAPQMGAGAETFQAARKLAETLGLPAAAITSPTEVARMQLGKAVIDELGGLGAQISDADRKFMMETQGSLGTDPTAMRRILLLRTKYLMQAQNRLSAEADKIINHPNMQGVPFPNYNFGGNDFQIPEPLVPEFESLLTGKPTPMRVPKVPGAGPSGRPLPPGVQRVP